MSAQLDGKRHRLHPLLNIAPSPGSANDHLILAVIDGGKVIRNAIRGILGKNAVVQRCQRHKTENVLGHLPKKKHPHVL